MMKEGKLLGELAWKIKRSSLDKMDIWAFSSLYALLCALQLVAKHDYQITLSFSHGAKSRFNYKIIEVRNKSDLLD